MHIQGGNSGLLDFKLLGATWSYFELLQVVLFEVVFYFEFTWSYLKYFKSLFPTWSHLKLLWGTWSSVLRRTFGLEVRRFPLDAYQYGLKRVLPAIGTRYSLKTSGNKLHKEKLGRPRCHSVDDKSICSRENRQVPIGDIVAVSILNTSYDAWGSFSHDNGRISIISYDAGIYIRTHAHRWKDHWGRLVYEYLHVEWTAFPLSLFVAMMKPDKIGRSIGFALAGSLNRRVIARDSPGWSSNSVGSMSTSFHIEKILGVIVCHEWLIDCLAQSASIVSTSFFNGVPCQNTVRYEHGRFHYQL